MPIVLADGMPHSAKFQAIEKQGLSIRDQAETLPIGRKTALQSTEFPKFLKV